MDSPPGGGSLYGTICEVAGPEAIRCALPGCLIIVPAIFFTSGMFSFILDFRVPSSGHGLGSDSACRSSDRPPST